MATQHEIIEALKQRGLAHELERNQFSGPYRKLRVVGKEDVFWYVRSDEAKEQMAINTEQVRRGKRLATSVPVKIEEMLKPLSETRTIYDARDAIQFVPTPSLVGPDVIAILISLREMVHAYWGRPGDESAGDGHGPPPIMVATAKYLLDKYKHLLPPEAPADEPAP